MKSRIPAAAVVLFCVACTPFKVPESGPVATVPVAWQPTPASIPRPTPTEAASSAPVVVSTTAQEVDRSAVTRPTASSLLEIPAGKYLLVEASEIARFCYSECECPPEDPSNWRELTLSEQGQAMRDMISQGARGFVDVVEGRVLSPCSCGYGRERREPIRELPFGWSSQWSDGELQFDLYHVDSDGTITAKVGDATYVFRPGDTWSSVYTNPGPAPSPSECRGYLDSRTISFVNHGLLAESQFPALSTTATPVPTMTAAERSRIFVDEVVRSVAFGPDGKTLAVGIRGPDGTVILWDVNKHVRIGQPLKGHRGFLSSIAFSPDGKTLASAGWDDNIIILWDANALRPIGRPLKEHLTHVESVAFSADNNLLASGSQDKTVILWDVSDVIRPRTIGRPLEGQAMVDTLAFNPAGRILAVGNWDGTVTFWDVSNPSTPVRIGSVVSASQARVTSVAFSPDGKMLATVNWGGIAFWDVSDVGRPRAIGEPLKGHTIGVNVIAFSPDGKALASGNNDKTIILWDVAAQRPFGPPLVGHMGPVESVAFSPNGKTLASGSWDQTVILWDVRDPRSPTQVLWDASTSTPTRGSPTPGR